MTVINRNRSTTYKTIWYRSQSRSLPNGVYGPLSPGSSEPADVEYENMSFDDDPSYRSRFAWRPCTHFKARVMLHSFPLGPVVQTGNSAVEWRFVDYYTTTCQTVFAILESIRDNYALVDDKDMNKRYLDPLRLNLALFIAELQSTLALFKTPGKFIRNAWTSFRQRPITRKARVRLARSITNRVGKTAADAYLTAKFGIEPLAADIADFGEAYQAILAKWRLLQKQSGQWDICDKSTNDEYQRTFIHSQFGFTMETVVTVSVKRKTRWRMRPTVPSIPFPPLSFSLNILNLQPGIKTLWELKPLSFVIDWFSNFGDVLDSLDPSGLRLHIERAGCGSLYKISMRSETRITNDPIWVGQPLKGTLCAVGEATYFSRTWKVGFVARDVKTLRFKNPLKKASDASKGLTFLALAKQKSSR